MNTLKINGTTISGIYVDAAVSYNKPAKRVQTFEVPGRNGNLIIDEGTFDNVMITYPVYEKQTFPAEFDDLVNWLASLEGYQRIECSNDPGHYRLGRFVVPQTPTAKRLNRDGYYHLSFDCKPQRWLLSGEEETEIDNESIIKASDAEPYLFRTTGGAAGGSVDIGNRETDKLVGGSVAWNQLIRYPDLSQGGYAQYGTVDVSSGVATLTANGNGNTYFAINNNFLANHVVLLAIDIMLDSNNSGTYNSTTLLASWSNGYKAVANAAKGTWGSLATIVKPTADATVFGVYCFGVGVTPASGEKAYVKIPQYFDLTAMFGSTIADYIYSLEQSQAGAGVAWFKKLFPKPYYAYNAGELIHVNASAHKMVGFNQWDEEWGTGYYNEYGNVVQNTTYLRSLNMFPVVEGATYFFKGASGNYRIVWYDGNKTFVGREAWRNVNRTFTIPSGVCFINFYCEYSGSYANDICINLHWDGERDGEYEPYEAHSYALDSDLVLRGIPKLDSANRLYYDGDTYESDGKVTRKYGIVDLGTLTWFYENGFFRTNSLNGVFKKPSSQTVLPNAICVPFAPRTWNDVGNGDNEFGINHQIIVKATQYGTNSATFTTAMSGVYLVYELATPTEEEADPYTNPQICSNWGTEEYVVTEQGGVAMPVGHDTDYFDHIGYAINNPTQFTSKPLIRVFGDGIFTVNDVTVTVSAHSQPYIDIDSELQECYYEDTNMNQYVSFSGNEFPELIPGTNGIMPTPSIVKLEVMPRWWIL